MLVLSRKNLQSLYFSVPLPDGQVKKIKVQVVGIGKSVRLGVEADKDVTILRDELVDGKKAKEETPVEDPRQTADPQWIPFADEK